jgi:YD repeat-containing protein
MMKYGNLYVCWVQGNTHTTVNGFDVLNQLKQETMPAGQAQTRLYDNAGNLTSLTDYNGKTTTYTYDKLNRLLSRTPDPTLTDVRPRDRGVLHDNASGHGG